MLDAVARIMSDALDATRDERVALVVPHRLSIPVEPTLRPVAGSFAALAAVLAMAGYLVLGKHHISGARHDPGGFSLCRQVVGALLMLISGYGRHGCALFKLRQEHYGWIVKLGFLNYLNSICFIWGFKLTSSFVASVAQLSVPVLTYIYTAAVGLESPTYRRTAGVCLIVCGCLLTAIGSSMNQSSSGAGSSSDKALLWIGCGALLIQTSAFVGLLVVQKRVLEYYPVSVRACMEDLSS